MEMKCVVSRGRTTRVHGAAHLGVKALSQLGIKALSHLGVKAFSLASTAG